MSKPIVWVHGDCLSPHNPALQEYPDAPAIWVWDDALIEEWQLSLKRLTFIYECLLELPVDIRRGDVAQEVLAFAKEHEADLIVTANSPSPRFNNICDKIEQFGFAHCSSRAESRLERSLALEVFEVEPFFDYDGHIDLKRFSRYWKVAEKYVME
ncbi:hypothetical protein [Calothrix sp. PCC 7507]|uniref:hypothetical protein n=1 Tax=Calothrix sp. PCC 7507 TaxID=99598 RepID=UPI00029EEDF0|nr:hypothetical protein [Calothrix sp. PCC 7507]AFY34762.1 hypothetical protein Cal7507_4391 [Calothrix sp. PCC 7507]